MDRQNLNCLGAGALILLSMLDSFAQCNPGPATGAAINHCYEDGFVYVDSSGDAGGYTTYWGYQNSSQIQGGSLLFHSRTNLDANTVKVLTDVYDLDALVAPAAPYAGTYNGPGPLIKDTPEFRLINVLHGTKFLRISGPATTKIIRFGSDGILVWTNSLPGMNYTIQAASALSGGTSWLDYVQISAAAYINTNQIVSFTPPTGMALIPAGSFTIGDTLDGESDAMPTNVYVSAFYMDTTLVSYGQWQMVYNWALTNGYNFDDPGIGKAANHPVADVNWYDCVKWCNARSQMNGLTPCYYTDASFTTVYRSGDLDLSNSFVNWSASGYRLPTEAECQKAARGGLNGARFPWGNSIDWNHANYASQWTNDAPLYSWDLAYTNGYDPAFTTGGAPYTSPVDYFAPNGYGLYDMAGNVQVWCWDWYAAPPYPAGSPYLGGTDPRGPDSSPDGYRVLHDGFYAYGCRCAKRSTNSPGFVIDHDGIRCVKRP